MLSSHNSLYPIYILSVSAQLLFTAGTIHAFHLNPGVRNWVSEIVLYDCFVFKNLYKIDY